VPTCKRLMVGVPTWRQVEAGTTQSLVMLEREAAKRGVALTWRILEGDALISRARSRLAGLFLRSNCDVLLSIDSDVIFEPRDALALADKATVYDVIGAMYLTRAQPQPATMLPVGQDVRFATGAAPVKVEHLASGFYAVSKRVVRALSDGQTVCDEDSGMPYVPLYQPVVGEIDGKAVYLSEDWAWCQRVREAGFGVWLDPGVRLRHVAASPLRLEDMQQPVILDAAAITMTRLASGQIVTERGG
jgi:hypothetical protein